MIRDMRQIIKTIIQTFSITFFCNLTFATEAKTEFITKVTDIKGNPKSVEQTHYKAVNLTDTVIIEDIDYNFFSEFTKKGDITVSIRYDSKCNLLEKTTFLYNRNNCLSKVSSYDLDENIRWQRIYIYNKKRQLIEREDICKDNSCYEKEIYKYINNVTYVYFYDIDGKLKYYNTHEKGSQKKEEILYSSEGKPISKKLYDFDNNGKIVRFRRYYVPENNLQDEYIYEYDNKGNLLVMYSPNDSFIENRKTTYKYNDRGYLSEHAWQNYDANYKVTYSYDNSGNIIEELHFRNENLYERTLYKYDTKGNWIEKTVYENNNLMKVIKRKIDYYNK